MTSRIDVQTAACRSYAAQSRAAAAQAAGRLARFRTRSIGLSLGPLGVSYDTSEVRLEQEAPGQGFDAILDQAAESTSLHDSLYIPRPAPDSRPKGLRLRLGLAAYAKNASSSPSAGPMLSATV